MDYSDPSIYYEALWIIVLFGATATLREAIGELCVHQISKSIFSTPYVSGKILDVLISCSNGGRSLGFGASWRMWNIDNTGVVKKYIIFLPMLCWILGTPIKIIAVQAVRGGNDFLGVWGTWGLGITWVVFCVIAKIIAICCDRMYGLRDMNGKLVSYRHIFQLHFCRLEGYGKMVFPQYYDETSSNLKPILKEGYTPLGIAIQWVDNEENVKTLHMSMSRRDGTMQMEDIPDETAILVDHDNISILDHKEN
jgi:hypothetical protein